MDLQALTSALAVLAGPSVATAAAAAAPVDGQLFPEERAHLSKAVAQRQAEFGSARVLARRVLCSLGLEPQPLIPNADRSPLWPANIVGSITHSHGYCAVAIARADTVSSLGIDLERAVQLSEGMERKIATTSERQWLKQGDALLQPWLGALLFSAKEAFYKCQYPLTHTRLDFQDVELAIDLQAGNFRVRNLSQQVPDAVRLRTVRGAWRHVPDFIVTMATLD